MCIASISTHLSSLTLDAEASAGSIKIISKLAFLELWEHVRLQLSLYRDKWSLHNISVRVAAANAIRSGIPKTGWFLRAINADARFITAEHILSEWTHM